MTRKVNAVFQILALTGMLVLQSLDLDCATKNTLHVICWFWQAVIGIIAHSFTPEGDRL